MSARHENSAAIDAAQARPTVARSNCSHPPATVRLKQSQWRTALRLLRLKLIFLLAAQLGPRARECPRQLDAEPSIPMLAERCKASS
jgi:hypothetical protein